MSGQHAAQQAAADSWSRKNEDKLIMIEQLQRELNCTVDALSLEQQQTQQAQQGGGYAAGGQQQVHHMQQMQYATPTGGHVMHSMPQNKFGYQDNQSMLEFLRSSQEALARLQVEHQLLLTQCGELQHENAALRDQNKRLLRDTEELSAARANAEGKLGFRFKQVSAARAMCYVLCSVPLCPMQCMKCTVLQTIRLGTHPPPPPPPPRGPPPGGRHNPPHRERDLRGANVRNGYGRPVLGRCVCVGGGGGGGGGGGMCVLCVMRA